MKKLLLIAFMGLFFCNHSNAQIQAIGRTQKEITDYLSGLETKEILIKKDTLINGDISLEYNNKNAAYRCYFFEKDTCIKYVSSGDIIEVPDFISALKNDYKKISDNEWISKDYIYKITLTTREKYFYATATKM